MLSDDALQKLLYDLFCTWHDVRRHYDPPLTDNHEQKMDKVRKLICKLLIEIDSRVARLGELARNQAFYEEWAMLTWNVLCITSRLQNYLAEKIATPEDKVIFSRLNQSLVDLVNCAKESMEPPGVDMTDPVYAKFFHLFNECLMSLHTLYFRLRTLQSFVSPEDVDAFAAELQTFADQQLRPCIDFFKEFCNQHSVKLWRAVRAAQIQRMLDLQPLPDPPVMLLVSFYSHMMYTLAILAARLQGFRYELTVNAQLFGAFDPVHSLSELVFAALELLMSDCVLATEPATNAIFVTNNLFAMHCGALARGVVFRDFDVQVVSEDSAEQIQTEMRRQKMLQQPAVICEFQSAALLAMKATTGTKREANSNGSSGHKKSDLNSKDNVTIYPAYNAKYKFWAASYPNLLCTTRQKGRQSISNSFQDLSPGGQIDAKSFGKRPIFYFHVCATMFSPSGRYAQAHTLSLPFTIATRRNQDCQVQRMMSSYTATCFWLYGSNVQDGLLLNWTDIGMQWEHFMHLYMQHFKVNADVTRGLLETHFDLLQYKLQCNDCCSGEMGARINGAQKIVTFKNILCPHLRYECGSTNVRFSVWRGMLELLQIFQDSRTIVRKMWEMNLIMGFLEFDQVSEILNAHQSALIMRLSFVTGGSICITVKSNAHSLNQGATAPMHLEPLDLKRLQAKSLEDYLRDIAAAEKVKYIINGNMELVRISDVLADPGAKVNSNGEMSSSRDISSNVTHSGDLDAMQHIKFTALRIAVVTCKVKPPSSDCAFELSGIGGGIPGFRDEMNSGSSGITSNLQRPSSAISDTIANGNAGGDLDRQRSFSGTSEEFIRELFQLMNLYGRNRQEVMEMLNATAPDDLLLASGNSLRQREDDQ